MASAPPVFKNSGLPWPFVYSLQGGGGKDTSTWPTTPKLGLVQPPDGVTGWGDDVNNNWSILDTVASTQSDWNATSGVAEILNKPALPQTSQFYAQQYLTSYNAATGLFTRAQPNASDISGLAPSATIDTTNASNITKGTLPVAQLPPIPPGNLPTGAVLTTQANTYTPGMKQTVQASATTAGLKFGGVSFDPTSLTAGDVWYNITSKHLKLYDGVTAQTLMLQSDNLPAAQVTGLAPSATIDTTNASNITKGTLPIAQLPPTIPAGNLPSPLPIGNNMANYYQIAGAAAGSTPTISALGSDTNVSIALLPKGTGFVGVGTSNPQISLDFGYYLGFSKSVDGTRLYFEPAVTNRRVFAMTGQGSGSGFVFAAGYGIGFNSDSSNGLLDPPTAIDCGIYRSSNFSGAVRIQGTSLQTGMLELPAYNPATSGTNNPSGILRLTNTVWTGSASILDYWDIKSSNAAGNYGWSTLSIVHTPGVAQTGASISIGNYIDLATPNLVAATTTSGIRLGAGQMPGGTTVLQMAGPSGFTGIMNVNNSWMGIGGNGNIQLYVTSAGSWFNPGAGVLATSSANVNYYLQIIGSYWTGSAPANDLWQFLNSLGTGTNPTSTLAITHTGTPGAALVTMPNLSVTGGPAATIGPAVFTGTGLNDCTSSGTVGYAAYQQVFRVQISVAGTPDQFQISMDNGVTWSLGSTAITGSAQSFAYTGLFVTFAATTGHTVGDYWTITANPIASNVNAQNAYYLGGLIFAAQTGNNNIFVGTQAAGTKTSNRMSGYYNTAFGNQALGSLTTGLSNTAIGNGVLAACTGGTGNLGIGGYSGGFVVMQAVTTGNSNISIGTGTLIKLTTGSQNTVVGVNAGSATITDNQNIYLGYNAGNATIGSNNVVIGANAGAGAAAMAGCVLLGNGAGYFVNTNNTFIVNNVNQASPANEKIYNLLYGTFSGAAGSITGQQLTVNGILNIASTMNSVAQTAATASNNYGAPARAWQSNYWNGSASAIDTWSMAVTLSSGTNPVSSLNFTQSGTPGGSIVNFPGGSINSNGTWTCNGNLSCQNIPSVGYIGQGTTHQYLNFGATNKMVMFNNSVANSCALAITSAANDLNGGSANILLNPSGSSYLNGGNVGIGTTAPAYLLDVKGSAIAYGPTTFTGTGLNDGTISGAHINVWPITVRVQIVTAGTPDQAQYTLDNGTTWSPSFNCTTGQSGIGYTNFFVTWAATTGHTVGDYWSYTGTPSTGNVNVANAYYLSGALFAAQTGNNSIFVGTQALGNIGSPNKMVGYYNTAFGHLALGSLTSGNSNVAIGAGVMQLLTSGAYNVGIGGYYGLSCMASLTSGAYNIGIGTRAIAALTTGIQNTAIGYGAGQALTTENNNTMLGSNTGYYTTGGQNTIIGCNAGPSTLINYSVLLGYYAGAYITASNLFIVNNRSLTNFANEQAYSLLYGQFSTSGASIAGQFLTVNGQLGINTITPGNSIDISTNVAATSGANYSAGGMNVTSHYWNGAASANDIWQYNVVLGTGTNPTSTLNITHSGSTGVPLVTIPNLNVTGPVAYFGTQTFTGTGLNDGTFGGAIGLPWPLTIRVQVSATGTPDQVQWSPDAGVTWTGNFSMTTTATNLGGTGVSIQFAATTGHNVGDYWQVVAYPPSCNVGVTTGYYCGGFLFMGGGVSTNVFVGLKTMGLASGTAKCGGTNNAAFGYLTLGNITLGINNCAFGYQALYNLTTGSSNTALGYWSLIGLTTGSNNTAIGTMANNRGCLHNVTTGQFNIGLGTSAASLLQSGQYNIAIGYNSLGTSVSDSYNIAIGHNALLSIIGGGNIAIGEAAGQNISAGGSNVIIGYNAGNKLTGTVSNTFIIGNVLQASGANDQAFSLLYGTFAGSAGTTAGQQLTINGTLNLNGNLVQTNATTSTTCTAGAASGLPTAPAGYKQETINGTVYKVPYYNV